MRIIYEELTATAEWELLFHPVPKHVCDESEPGFDQQFGRHPIGNGPYRWGPSSSPDVVALERWEAYPGTQP